MHDDDDVIVVDKPAGLVVHPGAGNPDGTLVNGLLARYPELVGVGERHRPGIVHRLDAGSSGLLVVARTQHAVDDADRAVRRARRRRGCTSRWCGAIPSAPHGIIDAPIGRSRQDPLKMAVVADGRPSRTEYRVLQRVRHARPSWRCSSAASRPGAPIRSGSTSARSTTRSSATRCTASGARGSASTRPFLHAAELAFDHPATRRAGDVPQRAAARPRRPVDDAGRRVSSTDSRRRTERR